MLASPLLVIGPSLDSPPSRESVKALCGDALGDIDFTTLLPMGKPFDLVACDLFATRRDEFDALAAIGPLAGIDEGGKLRDRFHYLVDCFPIPDSPHGPNVAGPEYLELPPRRRKPGSVTGKALVSFGGEDPADLGPLVASELYASGAFANGVSLVLGAGKDAPDWLPSAIRLIERGPGFKESLPEYDLVATHFGLSAYEAAASGCSVLLADSVHRHGALARAAGFLSVGPRRSICAQSIRHALARPELLSGPSLALRGIGGGKLPELLRALDASYSCVLCGHRSFRAVARFKNRSYFECERCGMIGQKRHSGSDYLTAYNARYFSEEYQKQYGKTYLEDFSNIEARGEGRIARITRLAPAKGRLLDIGCAYGPFLKAARDAGWDARGIDICPEAVDYVRDRLGIPALAGDIQEIPLDDPFLKEGIGNGGFDAVSLWFVIEHFEALKDLLAKIKRLLKIGGVLAASTPSGKGISRLTRPAAFFESSPRDHYSVWEPPKIGKQLMDHGFKLERLVVTGHHPERFPGMLGRKPLLSLSSALSRAFGLGDSFEFYARSIE
jgi:SAM-dependent methyltransferase